MTVDEVQRKVSSSGFVRWMVYLNEVAYERDKSDYLFAMLAAEVRRANAKNPMGVKIKDFLLNFGKPKTANKSIKERTQNSKNFWGAVTGTKLKGKK